MARASSTGAKDQDALVELLEAAGVDALVDDDEEPDEDSEDDEDVLVDRLSVR